jgi:hypothetical protein
MSCPSTSTSPTTRTAKKHFYFFSFSKYQKRGVWSATRKLSQSGAIVTSITPAIRRTALCGNLFLSAQSSGNTISGAASDNTETNVLASDDLAAAQKRRESRVRSDGCGPPQPLTSFANPRKPKITGVQKSAETRPWLRAFWFMPFPMPFVLSGCWPRA